MRRRNASPRASPNAVLQIHAELPLDRITAVLAGWLRKLEPLGHGNPEPIFVARNVRLVSAPRVMKERHLRLELAQSPAHARSGDPRRRLGHGLHVRLNWASSQGSRIDVAYRIRENLHPDFGGLEIEIAGLQPPTG